MAAGRCGAGVFQTNHANGSRRRRNMPLASHRAGAVIVTIAAAAAGGSACDCGGPPSQHLKNLNTHA